MNAHLRLCPDKVASVCLPFGLGPYVSISPEPLAEVGAALACRVLTARPAHGQVELQSGRQALLVQGDVMIGVLGRRAALRGFCGEVPTTLAKGGTVYLLNQGGVLGVPRGRTVGMGDPVALEVLGTPEREGRPLRLQDFALPARDLPAAMPPVLAVAGTCMHAGKTTAAALLIHHLSAQGLCVHAGKATGVACAKDLLKFADNGAAKTLSFLDVGLPSTCGHPDMPTVARTLLAHLADESPDLIVLELGDGLLGPYGVDDLVEDLGRAGVFVGAVLAANDIIGAWAGAKRLQDAGIPVRVITGPATDNLVGEERLAELGHRAANIFRDPEGFCRLAAAEA